MVFSLVDIYKLKISTLPTLIIFLTIYSDILLRTLHTLKEHVNK